jgi:hypothetical protein
VPSPVTATGPTEEGTMNVSRRIQLFIATLLVCVAAPLAATAASTPDTHASHSIVMRGEPRNTPPFNLTVRSLGVSAIAAKLLDEPRNTWPFTRRLAG